VEIVQVVQRRRKGGSGFTMVELLVVMSIIAVLAAVAIPAIAKLGVFSRDELHGSARQLWSLLKAARIYASTYHVNTAVVYNLDNFVPPDVNAPNDPGLPQPVGDSVTGATVRVIRAAAIMYELPASSAFQGYVPAPREDGEFRTFPGGMVVLLQNVDTLAPIYDSMRPRFAPADDPFSTGINTLGMDRDVVVFLSGGPFAQPGDPDYSNPVTARFPAHVFTPSGNLVTGGTTERYTLYVAPPPDESIDIRAVDPNATPLQLVTIPVDVYKSTGRVKVRS
jgi:prepilin-type N-terminal cleavage/methylation domain-containing protein